MLGKLFNGAKAGRKVEIRALSGGSYGGGSGWNNRLYGSQQEGIDYSREAGLRWDNSTVFAILRFFVTVLNATPIIVCKRDAAGKPVPVPDHPITRLLEKPNPWYPGAYLAALQIFGEASRGNAYVYKHRAPSGLLVALEFMIEGTTWPYTWPGSGEFISEYRISTANGYYRVPPVDVLQTRWATGNPFWPQLGLSPLESCLPDLVADKYAGRHEAMMIRNGCPTSLSVSPLPTQINGVQPVFTETQANQVRDKIEDQVGGDNRNRPLVWTIPTKVEQFGFNPQELMLTDVRHMSESLMCAAFGLQPVALGLPVGLRWSNNRASIEKAVDMSVDTAVDYMRWRGAQLTEDLVPELGEPGEVVMYDESKITNLKERLIVLLTEQAGGPIISVDEGRAEIGLGKVKGGEMIRNPQGEPIGPASKAATKKNPESSDSTQETVDDGKGKVQGKRGDKVEMGPDSDPAQA